MNFMKRVNGSWVDTPNYIHKTDTDTITTLPAVLYPTGTTATVGLKGQAVQSTTPTPDNPIMPQGTGERTGNLFNVNRQASNTWTIDDKYYIDGAVGDSKSSIQPNTVDVSISNSGDLTVTARSYYGVGFVVAVTPNTTYTISFTTDTAVPSSKSIATITYVNADEDFLNYITIYGCTTSVTFTTPNTAYYILITFRYASNTITYSDIMLNAGSTALPYEPYGIKIPILSADTTTPVYLGEVETTRKIKKLVLTGEENFTAGSVIGQIRTPLTGAIDSLGYCTHYIIKAVYGGDFPYIRIRSNTLWFEISPDGYETKEEAVVDFKSYLAQQYTNGTPVTVWYVLATETTGIVNEPLRKIGDYADEVSGITIPTIAGANTISVDTTLQPSEVTVNYKGWHPVADVHEKSRNLWNEEYTEISGSLKYKPIFVGDGTFTMSTSCPLSSGNALLFLLSGNVSSGASTSNNGVSGARPRSAESVDGYITIAYRAFETLNPADYETMLNSGSTALPYEPYWK